MNTFTELSHMDNAIESYKIERSTASLMQIIATRGYTEQFCMRLRYIRNKEAKRITRATRRNNKFFSTDQY